MSAVPKPTKTKKKSTQAPQLTEDEYIEIGEKLAEAYEFGTQITITTFSNRKYDKFVGTIKGVNQETKMITFDIGEIDFLKISVNIIVDVE